MYGRGLRALAEVGCDAALDGHDGDGALGNMYAWCGEHAARRPARSPGCCSAPGTARASSSARSVKGFVSPSLLSRAATAARLAGLRWRPFSRTSGERRRSRLAAESRWRPPGAGWEQQQLQALHPPTTQFFEEFELLGARFGIDVQHPFADRDLIDFADHASTRGEGVHRALKPLLRDALADLLPPIVAERDDKTAFTAVLDARVDFEACYRWVRDSGVRLPDIDYGRLFRDAAKPVNDRIFWTRLASAHVFLAGA